MPTIIPVKFQYAARDLWFDPAGTGAQEGDHVICATERGHEFGLAVGDAREVTEDELDATIGHAQLREVVRIASDADLERADELARRGEESMPAFRRHVAESGLDMKPVGVEYLFDGEKAVCYFAAEERVDFRQLVRDLAREFHVRIDMRQIGVREEAAIVGGYGHCGQELCCRRFATGFDPVSIRMAKEQDLPLNSTKISGACGRLMCCLRYEFEAYRDFKGRAPKRNAVIDTPLGKAKIVEYDTPKEQLCLRLENGKQIRVALADMTASEAAHKKSEELGCPCRPDTVTREVLDKLESPDVQMALAELDRKNGVAPAEEPDASDIFVETRRKRRRGSGSAGPGAGKGAGNGNGNGGGNGSGGSRGEKNERAAGSGAPSGEEPGRRRRERRPGDGGGAAAGAAESPAATGAGAGAHRRRHHQAGEGGSAGAQQAGSGQQGARRTRRPGDKGGQAAQGGGERGGREGQPRGMQPSRRRRNGNGGNGGNSAEQRGGQQAGQGGAEGAAKPRRRRHRGGRGRGGAAGGGSGAAPAGGSE